MRIHPVFHISLLEPYRPNTLPGRTQPPPPPEEVEGELEYELERVLDSKFVQGKLLYLVDWVGYSPEERTWELAAYLESATDAVNEFHRRHLNRPSPGDAPPPSVTRQGRKRRS